jgi:cytoskeletal protein CcmA (bactofilin family)
MSWFRHKNTEEHAMFGNNENAPKGSPNGSKDHMTYMGQNVEITGTVRFEGSGRIDGKVEGKISVRGTLILGQGAQVSNEVEGDTVIVGGNVTGKIVGRNKVQLLKSAVVNANITTPSLMIEEGSQFNGSCAMPTGPGSTASLFSPAEKRPATEVGGRES